MTNQKEIRKVEISIFKQASCQAMHQNVNQQKWDK